MKWSLYPVSVLEEYAEEWDAINASESNLPILDSTFYRLLLDVSGTGKETLAVCTDDSGVIAAGIFCRKKPAVWHTFQPPQAPLGAWVQRSTIPQRALLNSLGSALPSFWLLISLTQLDPAIVSRPQPDERFRVLDYISTARLSLVD